VKPSRRASMSFLEAGDNIARQAQKRHVSDILKAGTHQRHHAVAPIGAAEPRRHSVSTTDVARNEESIDPFAQARIHIQARNMPMLDQTFAQLEGPDAREPRTGNCLLHVACQNGNKKAVKFLLKAGASLNVTNTKDKQTPLHYCYAYKYLELAAYIESKGADKEALNAFGLQPAQCLEGGLKPGTSHSSRSGDTASGNSVQMEEPRGAPHLSSRCTTLPERPEAPAAALASPVLGKTQLPPCQNPKTIAPAGGEASQHSRSAQLEACQSLKRTSIAVHSKGLDVGRANKCLKSLDTAGKKGGKKGQEKGQSQARSPKKQSKAATEVEEGMPGINPIISMARQLVVDSVAA